MLTAQTFTCPGDTTGTSSTPGGLDAPNGVVNIFDCSAFANELFPLSPRFSEPTPPGFDCMDLTGTNIFGPIQPDGLVNMYDLQVLSLYLLSVPNFSGPCIATGPPEPNETAAFSLAVFVNGNPYTDKRLRPSQIITLELSSDDPVQYGLIQSHLSVSRGDSPDAGFDLSGWLISGGEATPNETDGLDIFFNATVMFPRDPGFIWQIDFHVPPDVPGNKIIIDADAGHWDGVAAVPGPGDGLPYLKLTLSCPYLGDGTTTDTTPADGLNGGDMDVFDLRALANELVPLAPGFSESTPAGLECFDITDTDTEPNDGLPGPNGTLDIFDLQAMVNHILPLWPTGYFPCVQ